jgi:long-chain acyl-CoA synthetase
VAFVPRNRPNSAAALLAMIAQGRTIYMVYAFQTPEALARNLRSSKSACWSSPGVILSALWSRPRSRWAPVWYCWTRRPRKRSRPVPNSPQTADQPTSGGRTRHLHFDQRHDRCAETFQTAYRTESSTEQVLSARLMFGKTADDGKPAVPTLIYFPFANISGLYHFLPVADQRQSGDHAGESSILGYGWST